MEFNCELKRKNELEKWQGRIKFIKDYGSHYEIFIESRSSIMLTFGKTSRGGFACAPDYNVGCHLVDLKDLFWNTEKLSNILGKVDGLTAARALYHLYLNYPEFKTIFQK